MNCLNSEYLDVENIGMQTNSSVKLEKIVLIGFDMLHVIFCKNIEDFNVIIGNTLLFGFLYLLNFLWIL